MASTCADMPDYSKGHARNEKSPGQARAREVSPAVQAIC